MEIAGSPLGNAKCTKDKNGVDRRVWESPDFTITKIILEEGGDDSAEMTPRFGAVCAVQGEHVTSGRGTTSINGINSP